MAFKEVSTSNSASRITEYYPKKSSERKEGDSVVGKYTGKRTYKNPDGTDSVLYILESDGKVIGVNSSASIARSMEQIVEGSLVKIVFNGKKKSQKSGRMYNDFSVYIDTDEPSDEKVDLSNLDF